MKKLSEIKPPVKIVTVLKITVFTPLHCWKIINVIEMAKGINVFLDHNSLGSFLQKKILVKKSIQKLFKICIFEPIESERVAERGSHDISSVALKRLQPQDVFNNSGWLRLDSNLSVAKPAWILYTTDSDKSCWFRLSYFTGTTFWPVCSSQLLSLWVWVQLNEWVFFNLAKTWQAIVCLLLCFPQFLPEFTCCVPKIKTKQFLVQNR